jgi:hypothetical protein
LVASTYWIALFVSVPTVILCPAERSVALLHVKTLVPDVPVQVVFPLFGAPVVPV